MQPASTMSSPRGVAIVAFARNGMRFVRGGGSEYTDVSTIVTTMHAR